MNSFKFNPLNNMIKNYTTNQNENNSSNNIYNNRIQNCIDLPKWAKQPQKLKLCFSVNELFLAFIEQNTLFIILYSLMIINFIKLL